MNKLKNVLIIAPSYPTEKNPITPFIDQLACELADQNLNCTVIAPLNILLTMKDKGKNYVPKVRIRKTKNNNIIKIYHPRYVGLPNKSMGIATSKITYQNFKKAVYKEIVKEKISADIFYGHFIYPSGLCAAELGDFFDTPAFLAYGESHPKNYMHLGNEFLRSRLKKIKGIISVSSHNKNEILQMDILPQNFQNNIEVFPNGFDENKFFKMDQGKARENLGLRKDIFIVAFVGHYIERKGVQKLAAALNKFDDVYSFFIGKGPLEPIAPNILFKGTVPNEQLNTYLNASDVFVLPTLAEGCCNAIIESSASGLPIISSNYSFNDDIIDNNNSIRINPISEEEIYNAIKNLKDNNELKNRMGKASTQKSKDFKISARASNIINFIERKINCS